MQISSTKSFDELALMHLKRNSEASDVILKNLLSMMNEDAVIQIAQDEIEALDGETSS